MKHYKDIFPIFLLVLLLGSAAFLVYSNMSQSSEYTQTLEKARTFAKSGVVADAEKAYQQALNLNPSLDLSLEAGNVYLHSGEKDAAAQWAQDTVLNNYPNSSGAYEFAIQAYLAQKDYKKAFLEYSIFQKRGLASPKVEKLIDTVRYAYSLEDSYDAVGPFANDTGLAAVCSDGKWGYVNASGQEKVGCQYAAAGCYSAGLAPVKDADGTAYYIDESGNKKVVASYFTSQNAGMGNITQFSMAQQDLLLVCAGGKWSYCDTKTYRKKFGDYSAATLITNGVGAVSESGSGWSLISGGGKKISGEVYEKILADEKNVICRGGAVLAQKDGTYYLLNTKGQKISNSAYDDAKPFYSDEAAAVRKAGKWIFVDGKGKESNFGDYDDARSFSNGFAAVCRSGRWGYINSSGKLVISYTFSDAGAFNSKGTAFVKTDSGKWQLLRLYSKNFSD